jgi:hypothetical protein
VPTAPLPFVCVLKSGGAYTARHVEALAANIRRFQPDARIVCLTDLPSMPPGIEAVALRHGLKGWFSKLEIFALPLQQFLYLDLDVVVTSRIDVEAAHGLWILRGFKGRGVNSSVLLVNGSFRRILDDFLVDPARLTQEYASADKWGDQDFIRDSGLVTGYVQDVSPNLAGSWRQTLRYRMGRIDDAPSILVFHGKPKPESMVIRLHGGNRIFIFSWTYLPWGVVAAAKRMWRRLRRTTAPAEPHRV